jgi:adenylate kinase family enzyme
MNQSSINHLEEIDFLEWATILLKKAGITSVIGDWGMGKSTFSKALGVITLQKVFHLEEEQFFSASKQRPINQFLGKYYETLENGNCIIDGNSFTAKGGADDKYNCDFIIERLQKSDAIVFFDGDPKQVKSDYIERANRVEAGIEKRIGGSWDNLMPDKNVAINWYYERKKIFIPKLIDFGFKIIKINNRKGSDMLIHAMKERTSWT